MDPISSKSLLFSPYVSSDVLDWITLDKLEKSGKNRAIEQTFSWEEHMSKNYKELYSYSSLLNSYFKNKTITTAIGLF